MGHLALQSIAYESRLATRGAVPPSAPNCHSAKKGKARTARHYPHRAGHNRICFTYVDNYAHGLITAARALVPGSTAAGKFYIVTDAETHPFPEGYLNFWDTMDEAVR